MIINVIINTNLNKIQIKFSILSYQVSGFKRLITFCNSFETFKTLTRKLNRLINLKDKYVHKIK